MPELLNQEAEKSYSPHQSSFEEQLGNIKTAEGPIGQVKYVECVPVQPESDVPIVLLGGFGIDFKSTQLAAGRLFDQGRSVIMVEHPTNTAVNSDKNTKGIDELQMQWANNLTAVVETSGHEKVDVIAQSGAALYATAATLETPEHFRTLVIESGAGLTGEDITRRLIGRFILDSLNIRYLRNPLQALRYSMSLVRYIRKQGVKNSLKELSSIASNQIGEALVDVRKRGVRVAVIAGNADPVFAPRKMEQNIRMTLDSDQGLKTDNVDTYSLIADKSARHGTILFDEKGIGAALDQIRTFEKLESTER